MATGEDKKGLQGKCWLLEQGFSPASYAVWYRGRREPACRVTIKWEGGKPYRLIKAAHLSRPAASDEARASTYAGADGGGL